MMRWFCLVLALLAAPVARAHPHVFVDVTLRFQTDPDGHLAGVEVTWRYDDFFSLLVLEDRGLDPDGDMVLSDQERRALTGFDLTDWPENFEGALFMYHDGEKIALGPPEPIDVTLEGGQIVTRHLRPFGPVAADKLVIRPYDPSYYAALSLVAVKGLPEGCAAKIEAPDTEAADAIVAGMGGTSYDPLFFEEVEVGIHYAYSGRITCAPSS